MTERACPLVLCAGMAVVDYIFRVDCFPTPVAKSPMLEFFVTGGGCAANAAIAIARLDGRARFAGPVGEDEHAARVLGFLAHAGIDVVGARRIAGADTCVSGIFVDHAGERLLTTRRSPKLASAQPHAPERLLAGAGVVLADNHFPDFVLPICRAARAKSIPVVLDVDKPTKPDEALFAHASHTIFSAEALRAATGIDALEAALERAEEFCAGFVAVTDGAHGALWRHRSERGHQPAFAVDAIDTLAAGDVFHAGFALALGEGRSEREGLRFASAAAGLKCTRFGGIAGTPTRDKVEELLRGK
jgi:sulfofructose kinase